MLRNAIAEHSIRNSHLLSIVLSDSINLLTISISSGVTPVFAIKALHRVASADGNTKTFEVVDYAAQQYATLSGGLSAWPAYFVQTTDVSTDDQLNMATAQAYVDQPTSATVHMPQRANPQEIGIVMRQAWELGLWGITVQRVFSGADKPKC